MDKVAKKTLRPPARVAARANPRPIAVDLFAGVGGLSLGFEQAGFDVVAAVEYDPIHAAVHKYNFPNTSVVCADASNEQTVNEVVMQNAIHEGLLRHGRDLSEWDGEIDAIYGGPPCQGFSMIGKRDVADNRNNLVFHFARIVEVLRPRYFVMENVPGMAAGAHGRILDTLIDRLRRADYTVHEPVTLNAKMFGVPQDRRRVILIGSRNDCKVAQYPSAKTYPVQKSGGCNVSANDKRLPIGPTVWDAIRDLPDVDQKRKLYSSDETSIGKCEMQKLRKKVSAYAAPLRGLTASIDDFSYSREWDRNRITNSMLTDHDPAVVKRFAATAKGKVEKRSRFHRLHPLGLCSTLRAGTGSERGAYTSPRPIHPYKARVITVREAARLHSFPDWFRFHRTKWHGFRQVGNSVPPLLGRAIAAEIVKALDLTPTRPDHAIKLGDIDLLAVNHAEAARHFGLPEKREERYRRTHGNTTRRVRVEGNASRGSRAA